MPYDGRFTYVRIRYAPPEFGGGFGGFRQDVKWDHDYPRGDRHFPKIIERDHDDPDAHRARATSSRSTIPS